MAQYELMLDVGTLDDQTTEKIYQDHDALVAEHADGATVTITAEGHTGPVAAKRIIQVLEESFDVKVNRLVEDLVSKKDIAERCDATPQAVGQWVRGLRHRNHPFPSRFNRVAGGVWLWGEVNDWLRRTGLQFDEDVQYPCRKDYDLVNGWLAERDVKKNFTSIVASVQYDNRNRGSSVATPQFPIESVHSGIVITRGSRNGRK